MKKMFIASLIIVVVIIYALQLSTAIDNNKVAVSTVRDDQWEVEKLKYQRRVQARKSFQTTSSVVK